MGCAMASPALVPWIVVVPVTAVPLAPVMKDVWPDAGKDSKGQRLFQSKTVVLKPKEDKEYSLRSQEMCVSRIELEPRTKG